MDNNLLKLVDGDKTATLLLIISLLGLFGLPFMAKKDVHVVKKSNDGFLYTKPTNSMKILWVVFLSIVFSVSYAAYRSGYCGRMTIGENEINKLIGIVLSVVLWIGFFCFSYIIFFQKCFFNKEQINVSTFFFKRSFMWSDLSGVGSNWRGFYVDFGCNGRFYMPSLFSGSEQLNNILNLKILGNYNPQLLNSFYNDGEFLKKISGKSIVVIKFELDDCYISHPSISIGKIKEINSSGVNILFDDGINILLPANKRAIDIIDSSDDIDMFPPEVYDQLYCLLEAGILPEVVYEYYVEKDR